MKSLRFIGFSPMSLPLAADDIIELHGARLLLLLKYCGTSGKIDGLTKLAKLDFFVRYPSFFVRAAKKLGKTIPAQSTHIESSMIRHHYGPWDKRYYQILAFLESRRLLKVEKHANTFLFTLTDLGRAKADILSNKEPFDQTVSQMKAVNKVLGRKNGTKLKELVYEVFDTEVKQRRLGDIIR